MPKVLLVDDEDAFRTSLARRLELRGYRVEHLGNGEDAVRRVRAHIDIDVVVLDRKMPGMGGEEVLKEIKGIRPEVQVVMLTGHGDVSSATEVGRLDAHAYLEKPCDLEELIRAIDGAREATGRARQRLEIPHVTERSLRSWLIGTHGSRPGLILAGLAVAAAIMLWPAPDRLLELVSAPKTGAISDPTYGFSGYAGMKDGETVAEYYTKKAGVGTVTVRDDGSRHTEALSPKQTAFRAHVMLAVLLVSALFWATGAIPIGVTALLVGLAMYLFGVMDPDTVATAYAKDAVIFIFGVLAMARAISKTGLDRRIGLLLLGPAKSINRLLFIFLPLFAIACSFVSEHALVAFLMPMFMLVYAGSIRAAGIKEDRALAVMFVLSLCFAANCGGPGSPAAGGCNAVMMGILSDYGVAPTFGQWVMYGLPFVPVMALVIAAYFAVVLRSQLKVRELDVASLVRQASDRIGPMTRNEYVTAGLLGLVILLWITASDTLGMGGPVILGLVLLNLFRIMTWRDVASIQWEVVALYASACALGKGLALTGAALYMADGFIAVLPEIMRTGEGLAIAVSLFTGITTNFMSDGATVAAIGPITVPMARIAGTHPWMVGLATAFASSFAHMLIIGTPNNAIAYAMAKDPITGEQLVTLGDFFKHGFTAPSTPLSSAPRWAPSGTSRNPMIWIS